MNFRGGPCWGFWLYALEPATRAPMGVRVRATVPATRRMRHVGPSIEAESGHGRDWIDVASIRRHAQRLGSHACRRAVLREARNAGAERFQRLREPLGVRSFGINLIRLQPGQRGRIHRHERQEGGLPGPGGRALPDRRGGGRTSKGGIGPGRTPPPAPSSQPWTGALRDPGARRGRGARRTGRHRLRLLGGDRGRTAAGDAAPRICRPARARITASISSGTARLSSRPRTASPGPSTSTFPRTAARRPVRWRSGWRASRWPRSTSPLARALETARLVAAPRGIEPVPSPSSRDPRPWEGKS